MLEDAGAWHTAESRLLLRQYEALRTGDRQRAGSAGIGNPSQPGLTWEPFDPARCQTMVFDNNCRMVDDPEAEVRKILLA